jgi:hypothetical protein
LSTYPVAGSEAEDFLRRNDFEERMLQWEDNLDQLSKVMMEKWKNKLKFIRQKQYAEDLESVYSWLIRDAAPMCEIEPDTLMNFFNDRWGKCDDISEEDANNNFKLDITMDDAMKQKYNDELLVFKEDERYPENQWKHVPVRIRGNYKFDLKNRKK